MGASINTGGDGGRRGKRQRHRPMGEINVTPFVDVMLVLLIIFMVTAPMMTAGISVQRPKSTAGQIESPKKEPLMISIAKDGRIFMGAETKVPTTLADLKAKMTAIGAERGTDDIVYVNGDEGCAYGVVVKVIDQIREAKFSKYVLLTEPNVGG